MSNSNILTHKINNIIKNKSELESNFPTEFKHMKNINVEIQTEYNSKIIIEYTDSYEYNNVIEFKIRRITKNKQILLYPKKLIGSTHINLVENYGPFIIKN